MKPKKLFVALLMCMLLAISLFAAACSDGDKPVVPDNPPDDEVVLTLDATQKQLYVGETWTPVVTVTPEKDDLVYEWTSDTPAVASVSDLGVITAESAGNAVITVSAGEFTRASVTITVVQQVKEEYRISLSTTTLNLDKGDTYALVPELYKGANKIADARFAFSSSADCVTVSDDGVLNAVSVGNATITVSYTPEDDDVVTEQLVVTVLANYSFEISVPETLYYKPGDTFEITVSDLKEDGLDLEIEADDFTYGSSNEQVAVTDGNTVRIIGSGTATITVTYAGGAAKTMDLSVEEWTVIDSAELFKATFGSNASGNYYLKGDIDLGMEELTNAFYSDFTGRLDGNGYVVKGIKVKATGFGATAMFGKLSDTAMVRNIGFEMYCSSENWDGQVGFVYKNYGLIENVVIKRAGYGTQNCSQWYGMTELNEGTIRNVVLYTDNASYGNYAAGANNGTIDGFLYLGTNNPNAGSESDRFLANEDGSGTLTNSKILTGFDDEALTNGSFDEAMKVMLTKVMFKFELNAKEQFVAVSESKAFADVFEAAYAGYGDYTVAVISDNASVLEVGDSALIGKAQGSAILTVRLMSGSVIIATQKLEIKVGSVAVSSDSVLYIDRGRTFDYGGKQTLDLKEYLRVNDGTALSEHEIVYAIEQNDYVTLSADGIVTIKAEADGTTELIVADGTKTRTPIAGSFKLYVTLDGGVKREVATLSIRNWTEIDSAADFVEAMSSVNGSGLDSIVGNYYLTSDIDLGTYTFSTNEGDYLFNKRFEGILDGNGHKVYNIKIAANGYNASNFINALYGTLCNIAVSMEITSYNDEQIGFVAYNYGTIQNVVAKRIYTGTGALGQYGALGWQNHGTIDNIVLYTENVSYHSIVNYAPSTDITNIYATWNNNPSGSASGVWTCEGPTAIYEGEGMIYNKTADELVEKIPEGSLKTLAASILKTPESPIACSEETLYVDRGRSAEDGGVKSVNLADYLSMKDGSELGTLSYRMEGDTSYVTLSENGVITFNDATDGATEIVFGDHYKTRSLYAGSITVFVTVGGTEYEVTTVKVRNWTAISDVDGVLEALSSGSYSDVWRNIGNFYLTADIDFSGKSLSTENDTQLGNRDFEGIFDGNGHKIYNMTTNADGYNASLFVNKLYGTICNLAIEMNFSKISGDQYGFIGQNYGTVENVVIKRTLAEGSVAGQYGGFCWQNFGKINNLVLYTENLSYNAIVNNAASTDITNIYATWNNNTAGHNDGVWVSRDPQITERDGMMYNKTAADLLAAIPEGELKTLAQSILG